MYEARRRWTSYRCGQWLSGNLGTQLYDRLVEGYLCQINLIQDSRRTHGRPCSIQIRHDSLHQDCRDALLTPSSEIRSLTFKFTSAVQQLTAGSVTLARSNALGSRSGTNDGSPDTDVSAALNFAGATTTDGGLSWTIPFNKSVAGITDASGSLVDNVYSSTVHATLVMDAFGQTLVGGDQVKVFHRLYGDVNNVKKLNNAEFTQFSNTFGLAGGAPGYNRYFDFKGPTLAAPMGSVINNADFTQFSNRFPPAFLGFVYTASGL